MSSEAAKRAVAKYQREQMESISIRVKRSEGLYNRIKQAATVQGVKPAQFIKKALVTALDGPTTPATAPQPSTPADVVSVPLPAITVNSVDKACAAGYGKSRDQYISAAVVTQLRRDAATEKQKRRPVPVPYECDDDLPPAIPPEYIRQ